jgi:hypothetical protein
MIDLTGVKHHPAIEEIVDVLCNKTQNTDRGFFQTEAAYFLGKIASTMRATIVTKDRGDIPVNIYALALATSGYGKGHSISIIENEFLAQFKKRFMSETLKVLAEQSMWNLAHERSLKDLIDPQEHFERIEKEFNASGAYPFTFDSATPPAVKQLRHKLLVGNIGAINLQIDEIGSNLIGSTDVLTLFLELYDQGMVKQKLIKNSSENTRNEEIDGKTPTNMLLFGTPSKLLDGGHNEDQFYSFLDIGYARRCIFGHGQHHERAYETMTPKEIYQKSIQQANSPSVNKWASQFHRLADPAMHNWRMTVADPEGEKLVEYRIACEREADKMPEHEEIRKAEMSHRYFKALKLAGAFAFADESSSIDMDHLLSAILLVEESGAAFQAILNREKSYVKLAKYIADVKTEQTHADLYEALPFYKSGNAARNEIMTLATAWGYKKHIIIKKSFVDGIEFFKGETLEETDLSKLRISYSDHYAYNYLAETAPFDQLHKLTQLDGMHWANHHFKNGHRAEENVLSGFNIIALDIDGGVSIDMVHDILKEYKFMTYTTKRHTATENRFRLLIPMNYYLELDSDEYKEFMAHVTEWLPFKLDEAANQRARKWETYSGGTYHYNMEGQLLDVLDFIPKTSRNESYKNTSKELQSLDNLERWFAQRIALGNRNNNMVKFALALVDSGMSLMDVTTKVKEFNAKLNNPLPESEIDSTVLQTVAKKFVHN